VSRPKNTIPTIPLTTNLPADIRSRLDMFLFSEVEGRVPAGAYQAFFCSRIREFFDTRRLDLEVFGFPRGYFVTGSPEMLAALTDRLKGNNQ
jgi:hypothetical protein